MEQPVWTECGKPWRTYSNDEPSFEDQVDSEPLAGLVVETQYGTYLIGEINELRGTCDDCTEFSTGTVVLRYRRVYTPTKKL